MNPLNSKWFSLFLIVIAGCLIFALLGMSGRREKFRQAVSDAENKVQGAEKDKTYLEKFITYFQGPKFMEKQARLKLNYKSPDEEVAFVFRDPNKTESSSGSWLQEAPNHRKWWYYVLGY